MNRKFCSYCNTYKPEDDITHEWRGSARHPIKKIICKSCKESKDSNQSKKAREAFGRSITARNKREPS